MCFVLHVALPNGDAQYRAGFVIHTRTHNANNGLWVSAGKVYDYLDTDENEFLINFIY